MKEAISMKTISRRVKWFFRRFHLIIYFLVVSVAFGAAVLSLNSMLEQSTTDESYTSKIDAGTIDTSTLERINDLQTSRDVKSLPQVPSSPRYNPLSE